MRSKRLKIKRILVPTDLSPFSLAAIEYAALVGSVDNSQLYLLHVVGPGPSGSPRRSRGRTALRGTDMEKMYERKVQKVFTKSSKRGSNIAHIVRMGDASGEIMRFSREEKIDLIVLGSHGRSGLKHRLPGQVADEVVRHSTVPVLVIKPELHRFRED